MKRGESRIIVGDSNTFLSEPDKSRTHKKTSKSVQDLKSVT